MARIPEEEIERIKREISLERLVLQKGVKLKRHGADLLGLCPFHDDHEPSLVISPEKNLWHCLGACQAGGSVIDWVMRAEGVSYRHALELLRADVPSLEAFPEKPRGRQQGKVAKKTTVAKLPTFLERGAEDEVLLRRVVDYYHETLKQSPEALEYLQQRGLHNSEMLTRFRLGFANRTLAYRLPLKNRQAGAELRGRLQKIGILRDTGHEHFRGSLVIPVFDEQGQVTEMYGRKVGEHLREGTPKHLYLPGPHRGIWNLEALKSSKEIILCESLIDALTFWCAGYRNVTTSYGVEGFTDDHRAVFRAYGTERVYIAYDRDEAGDRAAGKLAEELSAMGMEVMRVLFPKGMDANEYALKLGPAEKSLGLALRRAQWMAGKRQPSSVVSGETIVKSASELETAPVITAIDVAAAAALPEPLLATEPALVADVADSDSAIELESGSAIPSLVAEPVAMPAAVGATPKPAPPPATPSASPPAWQVKSDELSMVIGERRWRVRGLPNKPMPGSLRVNVLVSRDSGAFHVDTLELYSSRQRALYTKLASEELMIE